MPLEGGDLVKVRLAFLPPGFFPLGEQEFCGFDFFGSLLELLVELSDFLLALLSLLGGVVDDAAVESRQLGAFHRRSGNVDRCPNENVEQLSDCPHGPLRVDVIRVVGGIVTETPQHIHFVMNPLVDAILKGSVVELVVKVPITDATQPIRFDNVIDQAFEREARFDTSHPRVTDRRLFRIAAMNEQLRPHPANECEVGWLRRNHRIPFTLELYPSFSTPKVA